MEKIKVDSTWNLPPTPAQIISITRLCMILHIKELLESSCSNRREARDLIWQLRGKLIGNCKRNK